MDDITRKQPKRSWDRPEGASYDDWMNSRVARVADRPYDWNALKFQADFDPKYRRAQKRFIGTGGTGVASGRLRDPGRAFHLIQHDPAARALKARCTFTSTPKRYFSCCAARSR